MSQTEGEQTVIRVQKTFAISNGKISSDFEPLGRAEKTVLTSKHQKAKQDNKEVAENSVSKKINISLR